MLELDDLQAQITAELPELTAIRRDLHAHPQLAYQETYASELVQKELTRLNVPYVAGVAETGVVGWLLPDDAAAREQPAVGLRADMDALAVTELTELPYASQHPGLMHACGHDGHTAMLLGAVRVLASRRDRLTRPVKFVFQPAEEGGAGAKRMIEAGTLGAEIGGFEIKRMLGLHGSPRMAVGHLGTRVGPIMAATGGFTIDITSSGGHASSPQRTADPIVAAAQLVTALQTIVARNVDPHEPAVVTVGMFNAGHATNVIPDRATLKGTIRVLNDETRNLINERMEQLTRQIASAMNCGAAVSFRSGYPATVNDADVVDDVLTLARRHLGEAQVHIMPNSTMGGEDFSFFGQCVPSCFAYVGVRPADRETYPGLHTPLYDFNDETIPTGVRVLSEFALL